MGTLAYDPDRLALLATALGAAVDDLDLLRCGDPEAQPALSVAGAASAAFGAWRSTALGVAGCAALVDYRPVALEAGDLAVATEYVLATLYGWQTRADPTGSTRTVPPAMEAAAIGSLLSHGQVDVDTPEQIALLKSRLDAILADPVASAALAANLTTEGAAALADELAARRVDAFGLVLDGTAAMPDLTSLPDGIGERVGAIDAILADLAAVLVDPHDPLASAGEWLSHMRPYTAALVIAQMDAPSDVIGELVFDTLTRHRESQGSADAPHVWEQPQGTFLGIGDVLFPTLTAANPRVANDVLDRILEVDPTLLVHTVRYPASTIDLVVHATDPTAIDSAAAGATIRGYLGLLFGPPIPPAPTVSGLSPVFAVDAQIAGLAAVVSPWMLQFTSRTHDWGWSDQEADHMLDTILADDAVLDEFLATAGQWSASVTLPEPGNDAERLLANLEALGSMTGEVKAFLAAHAIDDARAAQAQWDFAVSLVPKAIGKTVGLLPLGSAASQLVTKGSTFAVHLAADWAQETGAGGAPPPLDRELRRIGLASDQSVAVAAYIALGAMTDLLIAAGTLPPESSWPPPPDADADCPAAQYLDDVKEEWLGAHEGEALHYLDRAMRRFIDELAAAESCQGLQYSGAAD